MDLSMPSKAQAVAEHNSPDEFENNNEVEMSVSCYIDYEEEIEKDDDESNSDPSILDQSGDSNAETSLANGLRRSSRQRQNAIKKEQKKENDKKQDELTVNASPSKHSPNTSVKKRRDSTLCTNESNPMDALSTTVSDQPRSLLPAFDIKGSLLVLASKLRQAELKVLKRQTGPEPPLPSASHPACGVSLCLESGRYRFIAPPSRKRYVESAVTAAVSNSAKRHCPSDVGFPGLGKVPVQQRNDIHYNPTMREQVTSENLTELEKSICEGVNVLKELSHAVKYISKPPARPPALILPRRTQMGPSMWPFFSDQSCVESDTNETSEVVSADALCPYFDRRKDHYRALNNSYRQRVADYVGELSTEAMDAIVDAAVCFTVASKRKEFQDSVKTALGGIDIVVPAVKVVSVGDSVRGGNSKASSATGFNSTSLNFFNAKAANSSSLKSVETNKSNAAMTSKSTTPQGNRSIHNGQNIERMMETAEATCSQSATAARYPNSDTTDVFQASVKSSPKSKYECELCPYSTDSKSHLVRHKRSIHVVHRPYACYVCLKPFSRTDNVRSHFRSAHPRMIFRPELVRKIGVGEVFKRAAGFSYVRDGSDTSDLNTTGDASMGGFESQTSSLDGRSSRHNENKPYTGYTEVRDEQMDECLNLSTKKLKVEGSNVGTKRDNYNSSESTGVWRHAFSTNTSAAESLRSISEQVRSEINFKSNNHAWNGSRTPEHRKMSGTNSHGATAHRHSLGSSGILEDRINAKHSVKAKPLRQLPCMLCNKSFTNMSMLETHVDIAHRQRLYVCPHHPTCAHYTVGAREYLRHLAVAHMDNRIDVAAVSSSGSNNATLNGLVEKSVVASSSAASSKSINSHSAAVSAAQTPSPLAVLGLERKGDLSTKSNRTNSTHASSGMIGQNFTNSHDSSRPITEFLSDNTRSLIEAVSQNQKEKAAAAQHKPLDHQSVHSSRLVKVPPKPRGEKVFRCPFCPGKSPFCYRKSYDKHMLKHESGTKKIRRPLEHSYDQ